MNLNDKFSPILKAQVKYRKVTADKSSNVTIASEYVTENFLLFLYITDEDLRDNLYVFFAEDFKDWHKREKEYSLTLTSNKLLTYSDKIFNGDTASGIITILRKQPIKKYTSLIIDGIFLEKAIKTTVNVYSEIYPEKKFEKPKLEIVVNKILAWYNKYSNNGTLIDIVLYNSKHHSLANTVVMPENTYFKSGDVLQTQFHIRESSDVISFEVIDQIERIIYAENVILAANDIAYEKPLVELQNRGIEVILVTLQEELGGQIFSGTPWGDITYPLGLAIGLTKSEL